ncbi:MAG: AfsR/SARP family transcriptional regulator [Caldilineaceae bacterium]
MPALELALLGRPQILLHGQPLEMTSHKAQALLYYLAMSRQSHSRQSLAGLLWTDLDETSARRNLRVELLKVRADLDAFFHADRDTIAFDRNADHHLDVTQFEANLRSGEPTFEQLSQAVTLYRGEFLEDFHVRDAPFFEEWVTNERERLWQMARRALLRLINHHIQQRNYTAGIACANLLLKPEPWSEEAHQQLMRLLALSGQRAAALAQYERCSQALNDEFGVPPSDETNALYDQIESGAIGPESGTQFAVPVAASTVVVAAALPVPFQAPPAPLHFVGRAAELAALQAHLRQAQGKRLVALVGMGGIGKTTIAEHLAHDLRSHFADGVLWAYVAGTEPLDILGGWAQAYNYDFSGLSDVENRAAAVRGVLADKQTLIVLDDVRSLSRVRPLLVGGQRSAVLLTTRDLDVANALGAQIYPIEEMTPDDGVQLLERILSVDRVAAEQEAAREICELLQNLPLAVEITAQRLHSRPRRRLADMAERLQSVQDRLDLAISDRAVRTSFMVSWESLDSALRQVFALLAVFEGRSFAAPALAELTNLDVYTAEDRLFALTALSLLTEEEEVRYRQHPLLADFAREQLGNDDNAWRQMALYYQHFAQAHQTDYTALQPEWENMMAGMETAHMLQEWQLVLDYADALTEPWFTRARYSEAREAYLLVDEAARAVNDEQAMATCFLRWGQACIEQDDHQEAQSLLVKSIELFQKLNEPKALATAHYHLGRSAVERGNYEQAEALLEKSRRLYEQCEDLFGLALVLFQQSDIHYRCGRLEQAHSLCKQALIMQEQIDNNVGTIATLRLLADIAFEYKDYKTANLYCQRALTLSERTQNHGALGEVYYSLAAVTRGEENFELALVYAQKGLALLQLAGYRQFQAVTLHELSQIYTAMMKMDLALQNGLTALTLLREINDTFNIVYVLRHLGDLQSQLGDNSLARRTWQEALEIAIPQKHPLTATLHERLTQG